jgi:hypothetical protein
MDGLERWADVAVFVLRFDPSVARFLEGNRMVDGDNKRFLADMTRCNLLFNTLLDDVNGLAVVGRWEPNLQSIFSLRGTSGEVNWTVVVTGNTTFLFCGGVNDNASRKGILDGWSFLTDITQQEGFNGWAGDIARRRLTPRITTFDYQRRQFVGVGHSGGGVVVEALYWQLFGRNDRPADVWVLTGTPRGLSFDYPAFYGTCNITRFMNVGDPIPILPPRFPEWPEFVMVGGALSFPANINNVFIQASPSAAVPSFQVWPKFHHPPGGIMLSDSGFSYARNDPIIVRSDNPITGNILGGLERLTGLPEHQMSTYVNSVDTWAVLNSPLDKTLTPDTPGPSSSGDWGPSIQFICPEDDFGRIVPSPQGRVQVMGNILQTGSIPAQDGSVAGAIYLRGQLVAVFPTRGKAKTAASRLNRFLARLPSATEVSTSGLVDGMQQYLVEAAIGGGVDRRPVKVVT